MVNRDTTRIAMATLKLLRIVIVVLFPSVAAALWYTMPVPPELTTETPTSSAIKTVDADTRTLDWYAPLWQRDLNQPPIPPESIPLQEPAKRGGPVPTLLATFVDAEARYAHLRGQDGRARMSAVNDAVDRFRIEAIEPGRVQLCDGDNRLWVELPGPENE